LSARKLYLHWNIPRADVNSSQKGGQSCSASRPRSRLTQVTPREASPTHGETHGLCVCATVAPSLTTVRSTLSCTYIFKGCTPLSRALLPALGWSRDDGVGRRYRPGLLLPLDDRLLPSRFLEDGVWGTSSSVPSPFRCCPELFPWCTPLPRPPRSLPATSRAGPVDQLARQHHLPSVCHGWGRRNARGGGAPPDGAIGQFERRGLAVAWRNDGFFFTTERTHVTGVDALDIVGRSRPWSGRARSPDRRFNNSV